MAAGPGKLREGSPGLTSEGELGSRHHIYHSLEESRQWRSNCVERTEDYYLRVNMKFCFRTSRRNSEVEVMGH